MQERPGQKSMCVADSQYLEKRQVQELHVLGWSSLGICAQEEQIS